jgi:hypothetical protein
MRSAAVLILAWGFFWCAPATAGKRPAAEVRRILKLTQREKPLKEAHVQSLEAIMSSAINKAGDVMDPNLVQTYSDGHSKLSKLARGAHTDRLAAIYERVRYAQERAAYKFGTGGGTLVDTQLFDAVTARGGVTHQDIGRLELSIRTELATSGVFGEDLLGPTEFAKVLAKALTANLAKLREGQRLQKITIEPGVFERIEDLAQKISEYKGSDSRHLLERLRPFPDPRDNRKPKP